MKRMAILLLAAATTVAAFVISDSASGEAPRKDLLLADFEGDDYGQWQIEGDAFGSAPARGALADQQPVTGFQGRGLVNTYIAGDGPTGTAVSPPFKIARDYINLLVGGGAHADQTAVNLIVDGRVVTSATGANEEQLLPHTFDLRAYRGASARIQIVDKHSGGWGHINVDHIVLSDTPAVGRLYDEPLRPRYHFTSPRNWINDPNGLVYHDGEWHLFFQHNPFGNRWGHMSWGHAVSKDLVHWDHLPVAIPEADGVMIFSGSAVYDARNTSGFARDGVAPIVAIYTGHHVDSRKQDQRIAYSLDKGRSFTNYDGNPVIDINNIDGFRDPKVFWHEATSKWIMLVAMANEKRVRFYGSANLREWDHLSDFGPAGVEHKANWECPDLFELPVENGEPGESRWVLEVDMGGGAIAGGSGGEYFIGSFDGERFTPDEADPPVRWVDYGTDFYAPVSWNNVPQNDGRRIWIGWFNNWQYAGDIPTYPWRGAMTIPRTLSLWRTDAGLRLTQRPIRELQSLRGERIEITDRQLTGIDNLDHRVSGDSIEILATFDVGDAEHVGLRVRVGDDEETVVGYDTGTSELVVDRRRSGDSAFKDGFAKLMVAPLPTEAGRIRIHVFVDRSSVEVFGNDGYSSITARIFPSIDSRAVQAFAHGGRATLVELEAWPLRSIWSQPDQDRN